MENKEKNFMSAVIYVHNAEDRIEHFLKTIIDVFQENFEHSEIICVNDCSDDRSVAKIKEVSVIANSTSISILNMSYFHGLEVAMNAGVDLSIGDFVFEFDSTNLDFDKTDIINVYKKSLQGYDIVSATADKKEKITSRLFYNVFDRFTDLSYQMHTESFRVLSRRVINRISSMNKAIPYRKAIYANCGLRTDILIYKSKMSDIEKIDKKEKKYRRGLATDSLILFTDVGYHFSIAMTALMMSMMVCVAIYTVVAYLISNPVSGWTSTILFLSVGFFGLFGILTVIIKYLQLLVELVFKKKEYNFESIEKLTR
ncbi:glycosyltransferase [uncultured Clostridium sp.]|uniref:glycosyltransferase n=1 Tax=uncultured Clostridium sp. TaxID=59620 RepID=UPI0025EC309C|nr:glycosyltransferase [uncultured Clostridium sp.]